MKDKLPTAQEIRRREKQRHDQEGLEAFHRRLLARELLFGKGNGKHKNLTMPERLFIRAVKREAYRAYLDRCATGKTRFKTYRLTPLIRKEILKFKIWMNIWYGGNKRTYLYKDIPRKMKARMEELRNASRNTAVPEFQGEQTVQPERRAARQ